jgi:hypothetical protein
MVRVGGGAVAAMGLNMTKKVRVEIRRLVADYMRSEGCSCCRDTDAHEKHAEALAKVLGVKKYSDGSGYDFAQYRSTR